MKNLMKRFWRQFWAGGMEDEPLVEVVRAASVDPQIKSSLFMILRMEDGQRKTAVKSLIVRLQQQQAPSGLVTALAFLEDDKFARTTLDLLERDL